MAREGRCGFDRPAGPSAVFDVESVEVAVVDGDRWSLDQTIDIVVGTGAGQGKTIGVATTCECASVGCEEPLRSGGTLRDQTLWFVERGEHVRLHDLATFREGRGASECLIEVLIRASTRSVISGGRWITTSTSGIDRPAPDAMIDIRHAQLQALCHDPTELQRELRSHLERYCPRRLRHLDPAEIDRRIAVGIERARYYGMQQRGSIMLFVGLMFAVGPRFDEHPFLRRILRNTRVDPQQRMHELVTTIPRSIWSRAERANHAEDWRPLPRISGSA